jgi:hypothetical protein
MGEPIRTWSLAPVKRVTPLSDGLGKAGTVYQLGHCHVR